VRKLRERRHLEDLSVHGKIVLKYIFEEENGVINWIAWLRRGTGVDLL
jgi:hypothetical protein